MARKPIQELGELQQTIMERLWEVGEATAQDVLEATQRQRSRKVAYTTILSAMQKLERNGWLRHRREGRSYVYRPSQSRESEGLRSLRRFTSRVFGGDPLLLFEHLMQDQSLGAEELLELQRRIEARRKELES